MIAAAGAALIVLGGSDRVRAQVSAATRSAAATAAAGAAYEPLPAVTADASASSGTAASPGPSGSTSAAGASGHPTAGSATSAGETSTSRVVTYDSDADVAPRPPPASGTMMVPSARPRPDDADSASATSEIPQSVPAQAADANTLPAPSPDDNGQVINYEVRQDPQLIDPQLHSLQEFIDDGDESSLLGMELQEDSRKLASGEQADGLLVVAVTPGTPAALAGLHANQRTTHDVIEGAAVAAAMFFPPAIIVLPILDQVHMGESYDLIIGVDGARVCNLIDFEDQMRDVQPGEIVYLSIVRNGSRVQVPVNVPRVLNTPGF